ncbi:MAG: NPCBM/NEW2 domain-containing protein, partial [Verrucomicrobia bacterium]|nr:NPCBM/NEW2 domain-containing protein [Verrucomicrobiota bacterium]
MKHSPKPGNVLPWLLIAATLTTASAKTVWLDELDVSRTQQGWGQPRVNRSVDGNPLRIAGRAFATQRGRIEFKLPGDGPLLWTSGKLTSGQPAGAVEVNLDGVQHLVLAVTDAGDGINYDHADWAEARIEFSGGDPIAAALPTEEPVILTPPAPPTPRINGARVVGCRPGRPFLFMIPATGNRPMTFRADGLPSGLRLDPATGLITGEVAERGEFGVTLQASNALGQTQRSLKIVCGDTLALTPPMGWNSWNCFAHDVSAERVRAAADAMVSSGLIQHGWTYINIDDFWEQNPQAMEKDPSLGGPGRDEQG